MSESGSDSSCGSSCGSDGESGSSCEGDSVVEKDMRYLICGVSEWQMREIRQDRTGLFSF